MIKALEDIAKERELQDKKWGDIKEQAKIHDIGSWMTVLGEEFGESCQEALRFKFDQDFSKKSKYLKALREELIQVAAVAVAIIQSIDEEFIYG